MERAWERGGCENRPSAENHQKGRTRCLTSNAKKSRIVSCKIIHTVGKLATFFFVDRLFPH